jgi:serine phosphatase RsbU (regulator of sigma subunit)
MPFQRPPPAFAFGKITGHWDSKPCHGEAHSGDALFTEVGRTDGQLLLLLVDVTGHGASATQTVDLLEKHLLPDRHYHDRTAGELLKKLNEALQQEFAATGRFVAALALRIDPSTQSLEGSTAAQPDPFRRQPGSAWALWPVAGGPPLGVPDPSFPYPACAGRLIIGEALLAFTDGVTEAGAHSVRPQFQRGELQACLAQVPDGASSQQVVDGLMLALHHYVLSAWPEDDTTAVCLQLH